VPGEEVRGTGPEANERTTIVELEGRVDESLDARPIARGESTRDAIDRSRRGVDERRRGRLDRHQRAVVAAERVEAGERLGRAVGLEELQPRHQAVGAEDSEPQEVPLVRPAAAAIGARVHPAHEERIGA
jgi:hypothetical protein